MKPISLRVSIMGGIVIVAILGLSLVNLSSAQTADPSSSPTSTIPSESGASSLSDQTITLPSSTSSDSDATSTDITQPSLSDASDSSSVPAVIESATSTPSSTMTLTPIQSDAFAVTSTISTPLTELSLSASSSATSTFSSSSSTVSSTIVRVSLPPAPVPTGYATCDQSVKNVPGDYPTIQAAIDATSFGDTVKVAAGTYAENLTLKSGICLEGSGVDQTIISKSGASGITGTGVSYVIIKNLTVKDSGCAPGLCGGGGDGGGVQLSGSNNIILRSCRLTGNVAVNGGGMYASGSSVTMDHCLIDANRANNVGAGMLADSSSAVTLTNITVANNTWSNAFGNGGVGGISSGSSLQMANSILWGNNDKNFSGNGPHVSNSDIDGWSGGSDNIRSNPSFVSAADYHLQGGSAAVGMGAY